MFINFIADSISEYKVTKNVDTNVELAPRLIIWPGCFPRASATPAKHRRRRRRNFEGGILNVELAPRLIKSLLRYITLSYNKITATICLHEKSRRAEEFAEKHCGKWNRDVAKDVIQHNLLPNPEIFVILYLTLRRETSQAHLSAIYSGRRSDPAKPYRGRSEIS